MTNKQGVYVGIDVSKGWGDVVVKPSGERWCFNQDQEGIGELVKRLVGLQPTLVALEATGGYERALVGALAEKEVPVRVFNPRQVRDFAPFPRPTGKDGQVGCGDDRPVWGSQRCRGTGSQES